MIYEFRVRLFFIRWVWCVITNVEWSVVDENYEDTMNVPIVSGDILDDEGYKPRFVRVSFRYFMLQRNCIFKGVYDTLLTIIGSELLGFELSIHL